MKLASYALFGHDGERYAAFLPGVIRAHHTFFPDWRLRLHHDGRQNYRYWAALERLAVRGLIELCQVDTEPTPWSLASLWRFLPLWDPIVEWLITRDMDAVPLPRDRYAVEQFLESGMAMHAISDHPFHTDALLTGMTGAHVPRLRERLGFASWDQMVCSVSYSLQDWNQKGTDQRFLAEVVWPRAVPEVCQHRLHVDPPIGAKCTFRSIEEVAIPDVSEDALRQGAELAPFIGVPGFDVDRVVAFCRVHGPQPMMAAIDECER